jgi:aspartate aminotransferase-like enzyme
MAFNRKVKAAGAAKAVQTTHKVKGRIFKIIHMGSAPDEEELQVLLALGRQGCRPTH